MASTKTGSQVINAQTSAANSTYASPSAGCQSADQSQATNYGCLWTGRITNGGTGPTIACTAQVDISFDGTAWRQHAQYLAGVTSSTSYDFEIEVPAAVIHTRITFFGNTGQNVTVSAEIEQITGI